MEQTISVNFGAAYSHFTFNYSINLDQLSPKLKEYKDVLASFTEEELVFLRWRMLWKAMAREKQLPPKEFEAAEKMIWGIRSGRGFGKTLTGANWLGIEAASYPSMYCVVAPTKDDVRYTCFEGPTGLMAVIPPQLIADRNKALPSITLWNGSIIRGFAGDTPERLRGPQHAASWCDEIASWMYPEDAWSNLMFGLRLGPRPRVLWTGTPKPSFFIRDLVKREDAITVSGTTYENKANLPRVFFEQIAKYEGTKIGRQEIHGEVLDPEEAGYIKRSDWRMWPADKPLPVFKFIIYSLDTAFTERTFDKKKKEPDPTACSVWGMFEIPRAIGIRKGTHDIRVNKHIMLLDCWEDWLTYPQLISRVKKERKRRYGFSLEDPRLRPRVEKERRPAPRGKAIDLIMIEEKGSGISLRQSLAVEDILTEGYNPGRLDKLGRLHIVSPLWPHGRVWAVESDVKPGEFRNWADPLITQVCTYTGPGSTKRDDLLDTTTQALRYLMDKFIGPLTVVTDVEEEQRQAAKREADRIRGAQNPYDA